MARLRTTQLIVPPVSRCLPVFVEYQSVLFPPTLLFLFLFSLLLFLVLPFLFLVLFFPLPFRLLILFLLLFLPLCLVLALCGRVMIYRKGESGLCLIGSLFAALSICEQLWVYLAEVTVDVPAFCVVFRPFWHGERRYSADIGGCGLERHRPVVSPAFPVCVLCLTRSCTRRRSIACPATFRRRSVNAGKWRGLRDVYIRLRRAHSLALGQRVCSRLTDYPVNRLLRVDTLFEPQASFT